jgi:hypothetical protein
MRTNIKSPNIEAEFPFFPEEVYNFFGPSIEDSNYGLYCANDLKLLIFVFKDVNKNIMIHYYKLEMARSLYVLTKICEAEPNTPLSIHSPCYKKFIKQNFNGKLQLYPYNI